jgi:hypothetical protein
VTDAELVCLAVAQVLLRYDGERHWLRAARCRVGHLFPRLLAQSEYNARLKNAAPLLEAARLPVASPCPRRSQGRWCSGHFWRPTQTVTPAPADPYNEHRNDAMRDMVP